MRRAREALGAEMSLERWIEVIRVDIGPERSPHHLIPHALEPPDDVVINRNGQVVEQDPLKKRHSADRLRIDIRR